MRKLGLERLGIRGGREISPLAPPPAERSGDAPDQLAHRALALGVPDRAAEVLRHDDVRGHLRPGLRDLDIGLLEDDLAALAGDLRGAGFPLDLIEGMDSDLGAAPLDGEPSRRCQRPGQRPGSVALRPGLLARFGGRLRHRLGDRVVRLSQWTRLLIQHRSSLYLALLSGLSLLVLVASGGLPGPRLQSSVRIEPAEAGVKPKSPRFSSFPSRTYQV